MRTPALTGNDTPVLKSGDPEPPALATEKARLYSNRFCPFAERATIYAAAKGIPGEIVNIHLRDKPDWFTAKNPMFGKVPALELNGKMIYESAIIAEYLDDVFPDSAILPRDPYERAQQKIKFERLGCISTALYGFLHLPKETPHNIREEKGRVISSAFDDAEKLLGSDAYFGGVAPGYADWMQFPMFERCYLFAKLGVLPKEIETDSFPGAGKWPRLTRWWATCYAHPAVRAAMQPDEIGAAFLKEFKSGLHDYDLGL